MWNDFNSVLHFYTVDDINKLVDEVENAIQEKGEREITSREVGELVMKRLKKLDEVAYVRFASVYRSFKDINEFIDEVERVLKKWSIGVFECLSVQVGRKRTKLQNIVT